jgi:programmed cell death 6-interacting protein
VKAGLERAVRDNDLVYVSPVPPASQLAPITGVGMVKLATPTEVADPIGWLMGGGAGQGPLFSALVPYGVHLALSETIRVLTPDRANDSGIYDDRKDTIVRELDGKREELDGMAARYVHTQTIPCEA